MRLRSRPTPRRLRLRPTRLRSTRALLSPSYNRGIARDRLDDLPGAVADFSAAVKVSDSGNADFNADCYHNRGFSLRKLVGPC